MDYKWNILMTITLLTAFFVSSAGYAAGEAKFEPWDTAEYGSLTVIEGEILNVSEGRIEVNTAGVEKELTVGEGSMILMNGRPALLHALRPIAEHCYFMGRLWIDREGVVRQIEGDYQGCSVRILSTTRLANGGIRLLAESTEEAGEPRRIFEAVPDCRGVEAALSAKSRVEAYILFDLYGKVRGIFF